MGTNSKARAQRSVWRRMLSTVLALAIILSTVAIMSTVQANATLYVTKAELGTVVFYAPEVIYLVPSEGGWATAPQVFVNNWSDNSTATSYPGVSSLPQSNSVTSGWIKFSCPGASNVRITMNSGGSTGINRAVGYSMGTISGQSGVVTMNSGSFTATSSGLVTWRAEFTKNNATYIAYCYSYVYKPNYAAVSGAVGRAQAHINTSNSSENGFSSVWAHSGIYVVGAHSVSGGNRRANDDLRKDMWGTTYYGTSNTSFTSFNANDSFTATAGGVYLENNTSQNNCANTIAEGAGGDSFLQIDTSRYTNLQNIPQLRTKYAVSWFYMNGVTSKHDGGPHVKTNNGTWSAKSGGHNLSSVTSKTVYNGVKIPATNASYTNMQTVPWPYTNSWQRLDTYRDAGNVPVACGITYGTNGSTTAGGMAGATINVAVAQAVAPSYSGSGSTAVHGSYAWYLHDFDDEDAWYQPTYEGAAIIQHRMTTGISWVTRNKSELRRQLYEEIGAAVQKDQVNNYTDYLAKLTTLATALMKPDYDFVGNESTALAPNTNPMSMAALVKAARAMCTAKGQYQAKASYRSIVSGTGFKTLGLDYDNNRNYYLGEYVYAKPDENREFVGYRSVPVAVSVPGSIAPGGSWNGQSYPLGGTLAEYSNSQTLAYPANKQVVTGKGDGFARNHQVYPINLNTSLTDDLEWVWWMEPIEYKIVYKPGTPPGGGTMPPTVVKWDTDGRLADCTFLPPAGGYTFGGWMFQGVLYKPEELQDFKFRNLSSVDGYEIPAVAQWIPSVPTQLTIQVDFNGGTLGGLTGMSISNESINTDAKYSAVMSTLLEMQTQVFRDGYQFSKWSFSYDDSQAGKYFSAHTGDTMNAADPGLRIYALWTPRPSSIKYDRNNSGGTTTDSPLPQAVTFGQSSIQLHPGEGAATFELPGYRMIGWYKDKIEPQVDPWSRMNKPEYFFAAGDSYSYAALFGNNYQPEIELFAVWAAENYKVVFHENWHDKKPYEPGYPALLPPDIFVEQWKVYGTEFGQSYDGGSGTLLSNEWPGDPPERYGWTFAGWSTESGRLRNQVNDNTQFTRTYYNLLDNTNVLHLYARWVSGFDNPFDVFLYPNYGVTNGIPGKIEGSSLVKRLTGQPQGAECDLSDYIPERMGYKFVGWDFHPEQHATEKSSSEIRNEINKVFVNDTVHLVAVWEPIYYKVTFDGNYPDSTHDYEYVINQSFDLGDPEILLPITGRYVYPGYTLLGYAYGPADATPDAELKSNVTKIKLGKLLTGSGIEPPTTEIKLYAVWKINGGVPDPGDYPEDPDAEIPDEPQWPPIVDPDGGEGYIVMYFTAPKDVTVLPPLPTRVFLTYNETYGASLAQNKTLWKDAFKTDGDFVGWQVIKYGSDGSKLFDPDKSPVQLGDGLLGKTIKEGDIVNHIYSIWVAPVFEPGYTVKYIANGGTIVGTGETETRRIVFPNKANPGNTYGGITGNDMPSAERKDHDFLGWWTMPDGGVKVEPETEVSEDGTPLQGTLTPVEKLPVVDTLYAHWYKTTTWVDEVVGWLSSDSLSHLPNWANLTLLGIGLPMLGITSGTFASIPTWTLLAASILGLLVFPLALMLPFLFPVIGALMPVWWPMMLIL